MLTYTKVQTEIINQQRELLFAYSGLSTEAEFSLKLSTIIDKLLNDEHFKKSNPSKLREVLLKEGIMLKIKNPSSCKMK
ncbi:hypothetical protein [Legionella maioricensis]|uniref:Uncharacterized protein n=1 Tax=Legionella maioricensis TaxID=2896528 RepID=A0A9X2D5E6_9GAMM|nr:hypothetical protein [Legionella maioricensis]MCL9685842.1 hypothetical protein [Legionella maioricensis]MCL9689248.1 hypothetical protein [Legionella maioricensis]